MSAADGTESFEPDVLEYSSVAMPSFAEESLLWHEDVLVLYRGQKETELHPGQESWGLFWDVADRVGAWDWQRKYEDTGILDGESWSIRIVYRDRRIEASGVNAYPPGYGDLIAAMNRLVDGRLRS